MKYGAVSVMRRYADGSKAKPRRGWLSKQCVWIGKGDETDSPLLQTEGKPERTQGRFAKQQQKKTIEKELSV